MMLIDTVTPDSFYNSGGHFLFYLLIAAHVCVFVDWSPLRKYSIADVNLWLASVVSAAVPCIVTLVVAFASPAAELAVGVGTAVVLSVVTTLAIDGHLSSSAGHGADTSATKRVRRFAHASG